jgi:hypothetical protein
MINQSTFSIKPFCKVFNLSPATASSITFLDSAGSALMCNYVQVAMIAATSATGYIVVEPSGLSTNPRVPPGNGASGTLGMIGSVLNPVELMLPNMCGAVTVSGGPNLAANTPVSVTYGVSVSRNGISGFGRNKGG